jgi:hypothetical protein
MLADGDGELLLNGRPFIGLTDGTVSFINSPVVCDVG